MWCLFITTNILYNLDRSFSFCSSDTVYCHRFLAKNVSSITDSISLLCYWVILLSNMVIFYTFFYRIRNIIFDWMPVCSDYCFVMFISCHIIKQEYIHNKSLKGLFIICVFCFYYFFSHSIEL